MRRGGHVVQLAPYSHKLFGGCYLTITVVESRGVQGFVRLPGQGDVWHQAPFTVMEYVGPAAWPPTQGV